MMPSKGILLLTTIFLWTSLQTVTAQMWYNHDYWNSFQEGYIVTTAGEKIEGTIRYDYPAKMTRRIHFRSKDNPEKQIKYKASELSSFYFLEKEWIAKAFNDGSLNLTGKQKNSYFLYPLKQGKLSMYEYYYSEIEDWAKSDENGDIVILPEQTKTKIYLEKGEEKMIELSHVKFIRFAKGMSKFLADCEEVAKKIADKEWKKKDMYEIADAYNACN